MTTMFDEQQSYIDRLIAQRDSLKREARGILEKAKRAGRAELQARDDRRFRAAVDDAKALTQRIEDEREELRRMGADNPLMRKLLTGRGSGSDAASHSRRWASEVANRMHQT